MYSTEEGLRRTLCSDTKIYKSVINGYTINHLEAGEGEPLLLIHGANFGWGIWYPNIDYFSKYFKVFAIDLPGAGRSTKIDYRDLDLQRDFIEVVSEFIKNNIQGTLNIIGCSAGGWVAARIALLFPEKINKLVFLNTFGFVDYFSLSDLVIGNRIFS